MQSPEKQKSRLKTTLILGAVITVLPLIGLAILQMKTHAMPPVANVNPMLIKSGTPSSATPSTGAATEEWRNHPSVVAAFNPPNGVTWSEEQKKSVENIQADFAPKLLAHVKKINASLTPEQIKMREEANLEIQKRGLKGTDAEAFLESSLKLSDDQKLTLVEMRKVHSEIFTKLLQLVGPEQRALLSTNPTPTAVVPPQ